MSSSPLSTGAAFDVQSLGALKLEVKNNSPQGIKEAAKQMEGMFIQMMLKSMRDASFKDGLLNSQQSDMFTSMYDQQISQDIAQQSKMGFADLMVKQMGGEMPIIPNTPGAAPAPYSLNPALVKQQYVTPQPNAGAHNSAEAKNNNEGGATRYNSAAGNSTHFISRILGPAITAAQKSGIPHQLIIAQAALESGWGNREIETKEGKPSHNLFGIKATPNWKGETTEITTTEYINGKAQKVKAAFKVYPSYAEALTDYTSLLMNNPRYQNVAKSNTAENAAHALQSGGYATDPSYAKKLISIMQQVKGNINQGLSAYKTDLSSLF
ncbi:MULTISPECIES: flagellar assembly peptidoglycan hydrolase FlgJ [Yersinia]|uniref:Peptidoglycan hydrolase FlgJ n=1 Tax=Yersinia bercovieri TaxID=634 RepID=A0A2G4U6L7_YERBE|nr:MULTISPECIES: flagellar assembly peptidoglycan hydrolase FlgJ [Yersinia]PHZ28961.1 flagellar assembly peptidoglycan hydrolase FlgJ [Yersinia bercovieri]QDW32085.1 flagellar assembly peptidoglycan hydrolase FlgJ [Yersinia sp. KBS0713]QKJ06078.1 flagellar assembly peptidoglycan hydrolase FlgJ [Yersinia bercovieri ATCC 43970]